MGDFGHGFVGRREQAFTALLPLKASSYNPADLLALSKLMKGDADTVKDGPDPEENLLAPAGYTYFGQFIDHDLTFDSTSSLDPSKPAAPTNLRTPKFDLDCVYGDGPDAQPFMYDPDGIKLLYRKAPVVGGPKDQAKQDLTRNEHDRAIIGDKRNDENSIVCQLQLAFIKYHNAVVDELQNAPERWSVKGNLFASARNEVRWTYQTLIVHDFLRRIVRSEVLVGLDTSSVVQRAMNYALYTEDKRDNLPREFVAAAYRFGHSGVRTGYRMTSDLNDRFDIFPSSDDNTKNAGASSLLGFDALTENQFIDSWSRFFPETLPVPFDQVDSATTEDRSEPAGTKKDGKLRLQFAYKQDPTIVDPLGVLPRAPVAGEATTEQAESAIKPATLPDAVVSPPRPSLALLNLLRGDAYRIQGGQAVLAALEGAGLPCTGIADDALVVRVGGSKDGLFRFVPIPESLRKNTPLWFYVLAEAQEPLFRSLSSDPEYIKNGEFDEHKMLRGAGARTQLGWVGGRIVSEVFYGLLDSDPDSVFNSAPQGWKPILPKGAPVVVRSLLKFADPSNA